MTSSITPKERKRLFLEKNTKYQEKKDDNPALGDFSAIGEDDEVWIMQCSKGTNLNILKNKKIKLPGRTTHEELETVAVEYPEPSLYLFAHKNRKAHNVLKTIPIHGSIILRNHIKAVTLPDVVESTNKSGKVPMPTGIKERHPLLGVDYKSKLQICSQIAERLKKVDEVIAPSKSKKHSKSKRKSKDPRTIAIDSDGEIEIVIQKKSKKQKKRKNSTNDDDEPNVSTKKKRKSASNNVDQELDWIQKL